MDDPAANAAEFDKLHAFLAQQFPEGACHLKKEVVGNKALLYTWTGTDPAAKPIALMAHQDMVPIAPGTEGVDGRPFAGEIKDGFIWGRGTLDNKSNLFAQMEAIELLIGAGFKPGQTVYLGDGRRRRGERPARRAADCRTAQVAQRAPSTGCSTKACWCSTACCRA